MLGTGVDGVHMGPARGEYIARAKDWTSDDADCDGLM